MADASLVRALEDIVGPENVSADPVELLCYARDASENFGLPDVVVWPRTTEEVSAILRLANERKVPVTPRGAGTCLSGGPVPARGGILMVLTRMNRILEVDVEDMLVLVEPGVVWADLNRALEPYGLFLPPDPASGSVCTIGGCIAENAGGVRAVKYGTFRDWVQALEVVLPTGEVLWTGSRARKWVSGYDLVRLFVGSEGTLGVITKALLRVFPRPRHAAVMSAFAPELEDAGRAVFYVMSRGLTPSAVEIMDASTLEAVSKYAGMEFPACEAMLIFEFDGFTQADVRARLREAKKLCEASNLRVEVASSEEEAARIWRARKSASPALARLRPSSIHEDITVPVSKVAAMLVRVREISRELGVLIATFGHAGDGNLHPVILFDERDEDEARRALEAAEAVCRTALELGGTLTGEHGIGISKARFFPLEHGPVALEVMKTIKAALDPNGILNPGKMWEVL